MICNSPLFYFTIFFILVLSNAQSTLKERDSVEASPPSWTEQEEEIITFTPPSGWHLADLKALPVSSIKMIVVGKSSSCAPWMSLASEPYKGTLKQYLKMIKNKHDVKGEPWRDLGTVQTRAGNGNLSQIDSKMPWGEMRLMHLIVHKYDKIYILTAYALKEEFASFYKDFFASMRSLYIAKDLYDLVPMNQRAPLKKASDQLILKWEALLIKQQEQHPEMAIADLQHEIFESHSFQKESWTPFQKLIEETSGIIDLKWQSLFLQKMEDRLFNGSMFKENIEKDNLQK